MGKKWHSDKEKVLHQVKIDSDTRRTIKQLALIFDKSLSATTEEALKVYIENNKNILDGYHVRMSEVAI
tara:strand:+ start:2294 stop:2500 length:207 start_codon:yes stop_codon:yes gene_type:complete